MVKITEEKKEEEPEFIFKDKEEYLAFDWYKTLDEEERKDVLKGVRMMASALKKPKLTVKQIFTLPLDKFMKSLKAFKEKEYISKKDFLESKETLTDSNDA